MKIVCVALSDCRGQTPRAPGTCASSTNEILLQIKPDLFAEATLKVQKELFAALCDLRLSQQADKVVTTARRIVSELPLSAAHLRAEMDRSEFLAGIKVQNLSALFVVLLVLISALGPVFLLPFVHRPVKFMFAF